MDIKILLADDHKLMREGLRTLIAEQPNMTVIAEAEDGKTAVQLASKLLPDIVIMDISMPGLNGIEATRQIFETNGSSKVIALSMHLENRVVLEMFNAGASGYLLKDCAFDEVILAIDSVYSKSGYVSPRIAELIVADYGNRILQNEISPLPRLAKKNQAVLQRLLAGSGIDQVAAELHISVKEAEFHRQDIIIKHLAPHLNSADIQKNATNLFLTSREKEILVWVKEGKNNWEIASILNITLDTVKFHLKNIFQKLNTTNRSQAISVAIEKKLMEL